MVFSDEYYKTLEVSTTATQLEIKKSYRRLAVIHHPDKNPDDPTAHARFQNISEAYEVLSNPDLRAAYDKFGKDKANPQDGFSDPAELFGEIFGGQAFVDLIGEISLMKDLTATMNITMSQEEMDAQAEAEAANSGVPVEEEFPGEAAAKKESLKDAHLSGYEEKVPSNVSPSAGFTGEKAHEAGSKTAFISTDIPDRQPSPAASGTSTPKRGAIPIRPQLTSKSHSDLNVLADEDKKDKKKKSGMTAAQQAQLAEFEAERARVLKARVIDLSDKLLNRISVWTETDKGLDVTKAFQEKTRIEVENLKMESFGVEILHAIGLTYISKATGLLKSQKFLGIGGFFSRLKDKGTIAKDTWNTVASVIDAQSAMQEAAKAEERGEEWSDEQRSEVERLMIGKLLTAAWRGSRMEIQSVLRSVCDEVLYDKKVPLPKRLERAQAILICGEIYAKAKRTTEEEGDYMAFEQLVAEAALKKEKKKGKDKDKEKEKEKEKKFAGAGTASAPTSEPAADAPNVPRFK